MPILAPFCLTVTTDSIIDFLNNMDSNLLCIPVIGTFSSGKSAVINTLLGYSTKLLVEDITPETAVPTEIHWYDGEQHSETVCIYYVNGTEKKISLSDFKKTERNKLKADEIKSVRIGLRNELLAKIPRILLVDMPGFGSGNDAHDRAINDYIENSMAYIIAFPADCLILQDSIKDILKELNVYGKPISVMITKMDKAPPDDDFIDTRELLLENIRKHFTKKDLTILTTSSFKGDAADLAEHLMELNKNADILLYEQKFRPFVMKEAMHTHSYLRERLEKVNLSESELVEREETLKMEMRRFKEKSTELSERFKYDISRSCEDIINDVQEALSKELGSYVSMAMNNQDGDRISKCISTTARTTIAESTKRYFSEKAEQYMLGLTTAAAEISSFVPGMSSGAGVKLLGIAGSTIVGGLSGAAISSGLISAGALTGSGALSGLLSTITVAASSIPIVNVVLPIAGAIFGLIASLAGGDRKRKEARTSLEQQFLTEVFPNVLSKLEPSIRDSLNNEVLNICARIDDDFEQRKQTLEKALEDIRAQKLSEEEEKTHEINEIKANIKRIEAMCNEL